MNISTRQLNCFLHVARLGSFTRAAEQAHITQPGLSAMMRDLEEQLGCRLFDRTTRSVSLTGEGIRLVPSVERMLMEMEAAMAALRTSVAHARGTLSIAVTPVVASSLIPEVCKAFAKAEPSVEVRIRDVGRPAIQAQVESGEADVGFGIFLKPAAGIEIKPLLKFPLLCLALPGALPRDRRHRKDRSLAWSKLPDLPLISLPTDNLIQQLIDEHLYDTGRANEPRPSCNSMQTIVSMVAAGFGMAILRQ